MDQDVFSTDRPRLFSIAYRMLGSASDAEDVLQDAWLRYSAADAASVRSPKAFATTIVTRLCLDRLKSARMTREQYVGEWLPEPVLTSEVDNPETVLQRAESVTLAFLVLLEKLSPEERAVFLLKETFEYGHHEIAGILGISVDNSRQLLHRAKAHVATERPRPAAGVESRRVVAERFARAFSSGDASAFTALLADDVGMWADGGGKASAVGRPLIGRARVAAFLVSLYRAGESMGLLSQVSISFADVNFEPAVVLRVSGRLESLFVFETDGKAITAIRVVRNPDKLARIDRQLE